jgi:hypothetical protein
MNDTKGNGERAGMGTRFLKGLRDAIVEEDPSAQARRARDAKSASPVADAGATPLEATARTSAALPVSPMTASLFDAVLNKPTAYTAFTDKLVPLEGIVLDERTRYQAAYALVRTSRSIEQVIASIDMQHLQWLDAEAARFSAQLKEREAAEVQTRLAEAQSLDARIEAANQQVVRLREELEARIQAIGQAVQRDRERAAQIGVEVAAQRKELAAVQAQFDAAARQVKDSLVQAKAKLRSHLA